MAKPYGFVCYAREDERFAAYLGLELRKRGLEIWIDRLDIPPGEPYDDRIKAGLRAAACVIFLWSRSSAHSENVKNELETAKSRGKPIIPVRIEQLGPDDEVLDLARTQYVDFARDPALAFEQLAGRLAGNMPRTWQLQAVAAGRPNAPAPQYATPPPAQYAPNYPAPHYTTPQPARPPERSSLDPTQLSKPQRAGGSSGLVIGLFSAAIGATGLLVLIALIAGLNTPKPTPPSLVVAGPQLAPSSAEVAPIAQVSPATAPSPIVPELLDTWQGPCRLISPGSSNRDSFTFEGSGMLDEQLNFASTNCSDHQVFVTKIFWRVLSMRPGEGGIYEIDFELLRSVTIAIDATWLNEHDPRRWIAGVATDVDSFPGIKPGDNLYDTLLLREGGLYVTSYDGVQGRTPATRLQSINTSERYEGLRHQLLESVRRLKQ
jgi:hypothetical protein